MNFRLMVVMVTVATATRTGRRSPSQRRRSTAPLRAEQRGHVSGGRVVPPVRSGSVLTRGMTPSGFLLGSERRPLNYGPSGIARPCRWSE